MAEDKSKKDEIEVKEYEEEIEEEGTETKENNSDDDESKKETKEKTFTQEQVTKMMAREKKQGRNSVYKELGIDPKDEKSVKMFKAFMKSQNEGKENTEDNDNRISEAEQRAMLAEAKLTAIKLGVKPEFADDIVVLATSKMSDDEDDLESAISELKTKYKNMFGSSDDEEEEKKVDVKKGTGSSIKSDSNKKDGEKSLGERLAAQRTSSKKKSSFWD